MASLASLRFLIASTPTRQRGTARLGAGLDLPLGRLHEVQTYEGEAVIGFTAALLHRLLGAQGKALWCGKAARLYAPGLAAFGLDPDRLIYTRTASDDDTLWAVEEALRCPDLAVVVGEVTVLDLIAGRRLQLAAERHGVTAIILRRWQGHALQPDPSAATTRWHVSALPNLNDRLQHARWRVERLRCRGEMPKDFIVDWCHATGDLAVAAQPGYGSGAALQSDAAD